MLKYALEDFIHFLQIERGLSENTLGSYGRDLKHYIEHIEKEAKKQSWDQVPRNDIISFL